jgi:hypothetical protein
MIRRPGIREMRVAASAIVIASLALVPGVSQADPGAGAFGSGPASGGAAPGFSGSVAGSGFTITPVAAGGTATGSDPDTFEDATSAGQFDMELHYTGTSSGTAPAGSNCTPTDGNASQNVPQEATFVRAIPSAPLDPDHDPGGVVNVPSLFYLIGYNGPVTSPPVTASWHDCVDGQPVDRSVTATMTYWADSPSWDFGDTAGPTMSPPCQDCPAPTGWAPMVHTYVVSSANEQDWNPLAGQDRGHAFPVRFTYEWRYHGETDRGEAQNGQVGQLRGRVYPVRQVQSVLVNP